MGVKDSQRPRPARSRVSHRAEANDAPDLARPPGTPRCEQDHRAGGCGSLGASSDFSDWINALTAPGEGVSRACQCALVTGFQPFAGPPAGRPLVARPPPGRQEWTGREACRACAGRHRARRPLSGAGGGCPERGTRESTRLQGGPGPGRDRAARSPGRTVLARRYGPARPGSAGTCGM
jgi:hypothetical protein